MTDRNADFSVGPIVSHASESFRGIAINYTRRFRVPKLSGGADVRSDARKRQFQVVQDKSLRTDYE